MATIATTRPSLNMATGTIGAEVEGISLSGDLPQETIDWISDALVEHKVLFFRDQHQLTRAQHIAFGRRFGELEVHPFAQYISQFNTGGSDPEVIVLESKSEPKSRGQGADIWHSDVTWRLQPSLGSILRCIIVPDAGGDTAWANMEAAYDLLDDETKARIEGLQATHNWDNFRRNLIKSGTPDDVIAAMDAGFPPPVHPVVRTHPVSGRKSLYVNGIFTKEIVGMDQAESDALLQRLFHQAAVPEVQVRLRWRPGTVAFWDNRSTQHYAVHDYGAEHRLMERVTICGDTPR
jgi:taurine dioxygenase